MRTFGYGGVEFAVAGSSLARSGDIARFSTSPPDGPRFARCVVRSTRAHRFARSSSRDVRFEFGSKHIAIASDAFEVAIVRDDPEAICADACLFVDDESAPLTAIVAALLHEADGVVLHASAIVHGDRAHLFIGPSEAGKTRVAHLVRDVSAFARDRVAVFPYRGGWCAAPLAGGDAIARPFASPAPRPVAGIARVHESSFRERTLLHGAAALAVLRESTLAVTHDESALLDRLEAIAASVRVERLAFVPDETFEVDEPSTAT